jgi:hypothetical protein
MTKFLEGMVLMGLAALPLAGTAAAQSEPTEAEVAALKLGRNVGPRTSAPQLLNLRGEGDYPANLPFYLTHQIGHPAGEISRTLGKARKTSDFVPHLGILSAKQWQK